MMFHVIPVHSINDMTQFSSVSPSYHFGSVEPVLAAQKKNGHADTPVV